MNVVKLLGFQNVFVPEKGDYLFSLAHGGRGSAKSQAGAYRMLDYMASYPESVGVILVPVYKSWYSSTLPSIREAFNRAGLVEGKHWEYVFKREELTFLPTKSIAYIRTTEKPESARGVSGQWFWMDEARDSPEEAFLSVQGALRGGSSPHMGWITTTPAGKRHWLYRHFYEGATKTEQLPVPHPILVGETLWIKKTTEVKEIELNGEHFGSRYCAYPARAKDNPHTQGLYATLVQSFGGPDTPLARQELEGEFVLLEGMVFPTWDTKLIVSMEKWPRLPSTVVAGVDFGFDHPSVIFVEGADGDRRRYILDIVEKTRLSEQQLLEEVMRLQEQWKIEAFACDTEDPRFVAYLRANGIPAYGAKKTFKDTQRNPYSGLGLCNSSLNYKIKDGSQGFFVNSSCGCEFAEAIENYELDKETGLPIKRNDDVMSAWRYAEEMLQGLTQKRQLAQLVPLHILQGGYRGGEAFAQAAYRHSG